MNAAQELWKHVYAGMFKAIKEEGDLEVLSYQLSAIHECLEAMEDKGINEEVVTLSTECLAEVLSEYDQR